MEEAGSKASVGGDLGTRAAGGDGSGVGLLPADRDARPGVALLLLPDTWYCFADTP
ncbi:hypothetical protein ACWDKQ_33690 [Saccharopolyspora sp. NPDC000995]